MSCKSFYKDVGGVFPKPFTTETLRPPASCPTSRLNLFVADLRSTKLEYYSYEREIVSGALTSCACAAVDFKSEKISRKTCLPFIITRLLPAKCCLNECILMIRTYIFLHGIRNKG